jgi:thiosulfate/3-mercaptopyruvate sulfurtransferase
MTNKRSTEPSLNGHRGQHLISAQQLSARLGESSLRVIDVTTHLKVLPSGDFSGVSGRADYEAGHIPSAVYLDLQNDLSDNTSPFRFTVPSVAQFESAMQRIRLWCMRRIIPCGLAEFGGCSRCLAIIRCWC